VTRALPPRGSQWRRTARSLAFASSLICGFKITRGKIVENKFLLRQGRVYDGKAWTMTHRAWLRTQRFDWLPLQQTLQGYLRVAGVPG
jgi:hypothetical protein